MVTESPAVANELFDAPADVFGEKFEREAFAFQHRLVGDPLFAPERLMQLAVKLAADPRDVYYDAGDIAIDQRWDRTPICDMPIADLLASIEHNSAWIVLRKPEKDPEYADLLNRCMAEIEERSGRAIRRQMKLENSIIFINSPHRISTYHIDRECSCLLQMSGTKTISIFDGRDREVLPEEEIERFWSVDNNSAIFKPNLADRAQVFELTPGAAVHIPTNWPHWVQNGPEVSVSLNINFHYHDVVRADVHRANYWLRRMGLRPTPFGQSPLTDRVKGRVYSSATKLTGPLAAPIRRIRAEANKALAGGERAKN